jgi:peptide/nickel transport system permease protein
MSSSFSSQEPAINQFTLTESRLDLPAGEHRSSSGLLAFVRRYSANTSAVVGFFIALVIILLAVAAPWLSAGYAPDSIFVFGLKQPFGPSLNHFPLFIFGNSSSITFHRSIYLETIWGARPTLLIGFASALLSALIGIVAGAFSGYYGGWIDATIMRLTDVFLALPFLPLVIALIVASALTTQTTLSLILIFSAVGWASIARLVRAQFLVLREQSFAEAARAVGVSDFRIIFRHLMPSALTPIIVATTFSVTSFILAQATLDFLLLSNLQVVTWGHTIADGVDYLVANYWWTVFFPSLFLALTTLSINFIGEGLRDALDVRTRTY